MAEMYAAARIRVLDGNYTLAKKRIISHYKLLSGQVLTAKSQLTELNFTYNSSVIRGESEESNCDTELIFSVTIYSACNTCFLYLEYSEFQINALLFTEQAFFSLSKLKLSLKCLIKKWSDKKKKKLSQERCTCTNLSFCKWLHLFEQINKLKIIFLLSDVWYLKGHEYRYKYSFVKCVTYWKKYVLLRM